MFSKQRQIDSLKAELEYLRERTREENANTRKQLKALAEALGYTIQYKMPVDDCFEAYKKGGPERV